MNSPRTIQGFTITGRFTVACPQCGGNTTVKYARTHGDRCKACAEPQSTVRVSRASDLSRYDVGSMNDTRFGAEG